MSYNMRRAPIACTYCRRRKKRCNGESPQCKACYLKGIKCIYSEPVTQRNEDAGAEATSLSSRIEEVENLLQEHTKALVELRLQLRQQGQQQQQQQQSPQQSHEPAQPSPSKPHLYDANSSHAVFSGRAMEAHQGNPPPFSIWGFNHTKSKRDAPQGNDGGGSDAAPSITIPLGHQTSVSNVLKLPQLRELLGEYPEEFFFKVEARRPRSAAAWDVMHSVMVDVPGAAGGGAEPSIDRSLGDAYLKSYLSRVHPYHPFIDADEIMSRYEDVASRGFTLVSDNPSALLLAVLALGATVTDPIDRAEKERTGERLFQRALKILFASWIFGFSGDVLASQALVLCALYFTYTVEPLMAWRLIHMASTSIQQSLSRCKDMLSTEPEVQTLTRLSWVCFNIESDILAEFHQPRSGIELLVDRMPFPNYGDDASPGHLYALAEISARSLLNRIHHSLFFTDSLTIYTGGGALAEGTAAAAAPAVLNPDASLVRVCVELDRQLEAWYESLPDVIRPDLEGPRGAGAAPQGENRQAQVMRLRYWSAKQNIYRAFVIYVTSRSWDDDVAWVPAAVLEMCDACLQACRMFLLASSPLLSERTPYTFNTTQFCLSSVLILSMAARSPALRDRVKDIDNLQQRAICLLEPWAQPGCSIKSAHEIALLVASKQRFQD